MDDWAFSRTGPWPCPPGGTTRSLAGALACSAKPSAPMGSPELNYFWFRFQLILPKSALLLSPPELPNAPVLRSLASLLSFGGPFASAHFREKSVLRGIRDPVMTIYLGNISYDSTEAQLYDLLSPLGAVFDLNYPTDSVTGKHRGYAFVMIVDRGTANEVIRKLNGVDFDGRPLRATEAKAKDRGPDQGIPAGFRKMGENPFHGGGRRR